MRIPAVVKTSVKFGLLVMLLLVGLGVSIVTPIDRRPYQEQKFFKETLRRLDSLESIQLLFQADTFLVGWSEVDITPAHQGPLAGYGGRKPKTFETIADSIAIRTIVFNNGNKKLAFITADLLVIHPELSEEVYQNLPRGWSRNDIFFMATHSHSSIGGWAPGFVGNLFAGDFDPEVVKLLSSKIVTSLSLAENAQAEGYVSFNELQVPELVKNRLVGEQGKIDPWLKILGLMSADATGFLSIYGAHATCLSRHYRNLSGDYPGVFNRIVKNMEGVSFSAFAAGAVGSMGPIVEKNEDERLEAFQFGHLLSENIQLLQLLSPEYIQDLKMGSFHLDLALPEPQLKLSTNLCLRPWIFRQLMGDYPVNISVAMIGKNLFIGLPCDFSGELAVPLYEFARSNQINLTITSFNGGYLGYIIKDDWYDLDKYEARTMSWYGPDAGSYLSAIMERIIIYAASQTYGYD